MREIKFRAWDKEVCEMIYAGSRDGMAEHWFGFRDNNLVLFEDQQEDYPRVVDADIMQYTGLKDDNGKEVYEGDIVRYDHEDGPVKAVVMWKESDEENMWIAGFCYHFISRDDQDGDEAVKFEVIGNIHENPELLK